MLDGQNYFVLVLKSPFKTPSPFLVVLWVLFLLTACRQGSDSKLKPDNVVESSKYLVETFTDGVLISAHRGGKALLNYPENCLETMKLLHSQKINMFEIDIRTSSDGQLVLMHDKSLDRTTDATDLVSRYSLEELKNTPLVDDYGNKTNFTIPSLQEVLDWMKNVDAVIQLDLKSVDHNLLAQYINKEYLKNKIILIAYDLKQAKKLHKNFPDFMISVSMRNDREFQEHITSGIPHRQMLAFTGTRLSSPELYKKIRSKGIKTILGTLGNLDKRVASRGPELYLEYVDLGIDILATDRPLAARHVTMHLKRSGE